MKTIDGSSRFSKIFRVVVLVMISSIIMYSCYVYHNSCIYKSIKLTTVDNKSVEYGSANYDINSLIKKVEGKVVSIKKNIDTNILGEQEVIVEVKKDNIVKDVPFLVNVVDSVAPVIELKEERVTITSGDDYDLTYNVSSVVDGVDGSIGYVKDINEESKMYYNFNYDANTIDDVGEHTVEVVAKDNTGNLGSSSFILEVVAPRRVYSSPSTAITYNAPVNPQGGDVVSIAYSLVGAPYISGSNGPYGFDCSGFVQYVYSQVGVSVSRSSSTQIYDGVGVSYQDAQPGDILSWGYYDGAPTHSALYVGNGQMVHATNPRQGVIASDVAAWTRGSGTHVIAVRRIG